MNKMIEWAKENMTPSEFKYEVFEAFAVTQMMKMEKDNTTKVELTFGGVTITVELTDEIQKNT